MARLTGHPARHLKERAVALLARRYRLYLLLSTVVGAIAGAAVVLGVKHLYAVAFPLVLVAYGLIWALIKHDVGGYDRRARRERRNYLRGAEAEEVVALELCDLPDEFHVYSNLELPSNSPGGRPRDIDHVVVGPTGVWAVSTKSHRGVYEAHPGGATINDDPVDWAASARRDGKDLHDLLARHLPPDTPAPWVQPVLVLPFAFIRGSRADANPRTIQLEDLLQLIDPFDRPGSKSLDVKRIARVVAALDRILLQRSLANAKAAPHSSPAPRS